MSSIPLPLYGQLPNCCGLSTYLMLINPERNVGFKIFLNDMYGKINFLMKQTREEFRWSVVMDYVLLKSLGNNILNQFLKRKIPESVEYYMPILLFDLSLPELSVLLNEQGLVFLIIL